MPLLWLGVAILAAAGAYLVGWPAWTSTRQRADRDLNTERYLAWRGRASERPPAAEGWTTDERRRIVVAAILALVAVAAVVAFFVTT